MTLALSSFKSSLEGLTSKPEFLLPFVAAQSQFRDRYYGLAAAAMLEDLFFDTMSAYIQTHRPGLEWRRPPRGEKGFDYEFEGIRISHKVSQAGPIPVAALWDATMTHVKEWNFDTPICLVSSDYSKKSLKLTTNEGGAVDLKPLNPSMELSQVNRLVIGTWNRSGNRLDVQSIGAPGGSTELRSSDLFEEQWIKVNNLIRAGKSIREIEIFLVASRNNLKVGDSLSTGNAHPFFRPGFYLLENTWLQNIAVEHNNRAILMPKSKTFELMFRAISEDLFVPIPTWFRAFAGTTPPDLYLAQKTSYDAMFSRYRNR